MFEACRQLLTIENGLITSLFLAGLVGGFTHCMGMCSPFVLSQINDDKKQISRLKGALLLPYHFGRITTYVMLGAIFHILFSLIIVNGDLKDMISGALLFLAALIFIVNAIPVLGQVFPWATRIKLPVSFSWITRATQYFTNKHSIAGRYVLGLVLGLMPCGLVVAAVMAASSASNLNATLFAMMAFGAGTVPALVVTAFGGQTLLSKYPSWRAPFRLGALGLGSLVLLISAGNSFF